MKKTVKSETMDEGCRRENLKKTKEERLLKIRTVQWQGGSEGQMA